MGLELRWGARTVRLSEDKAYLRWLGEWLGLATARQPEEKVLQDQQGIGIVGERVMERGGSGENRRERQLGEEAKKFRDEDPEWLRCGVITTQAEWVAEHVAGMGRRKGQWLQAVARSKQQSCAQMERKFQGAVQLWLQYRGVLAGAQVGQEGAYPCSCCKRWYRTVFVTGETGGAAAPSHILTARARAGRKIQRTHLRPPQLSWDSIAVGTKVRIPVADWHPEVADRGAVLQGTVVEVDTIENRPGTSVVGVPGTMAARIEFTLMEPHLRTEEKDGKTVQQWVGQMQTEGSAWWMAASEAGLYELVERVREARVRERRQADERRLRERQLVATGGAAMALAAPFFVGCEEGKRAELVAAGAVEAWGGRAADDSGEDGRTSSGAGVKAGGSTGNGLGGGTDSGAGGGGGGVGGGGGGGGGVWWW